MQAVRQIVDAEKLCSVIDMPEYMRSLQVEVTVVPVDPRADVKKTVKELQHQSAINGISDMTIQIVFMKNTRKS